MFRNPLYKQVLQVMLFTAICVAGCRFSGGLFVLAIGLLGVGFAMKRNAGWLTVCYVMIPFLTMLSPALMGRNAFFMLASRVSLLLIVLMAALKGSRRGESLPFGGLYFYLLVAAISSIDGWFPMISYLKILNFAIMLIGLHFIVKCMQYSEKDLYMVRAAVMTFAFLIICGSLVTRFIPSIGYSMEITSAERYGVYLTGADILAREGRRLFSGIVNHSQALAPLSACFSIWVMCDLIFIEKRLTLFHAACIGGSPILLRMTGARIGLLTFGVGLLLIYFYCLPKANLSGRFRPKISGFLILFLLLLIAGAVVAEIRGRSISRWVRKTEQVEGDRRDLTEAITASRMGAVEINLRDLRLNPAFGKGFQVVPEHRPMYQAGMIALYSAPIEKGVLPLMVLGETGVVGFSVFLLFLCLFYARCLKRKYVVTATMFTLFLMTNVAEATFFSPAGQGGILWAISIVGGFSVDMLVKSRQQRMWMNGPAFNGNVIH